MSKNNFPTADEMDNYSRLISDHELIKIYSGEMDVYSRNSGVQWQVNSYQDGDAHILRIPKNKISGLEVSLRAGVVTVTWELNKVAYVRRIALGSQHDPSSLKAIWVRNPVEWSACFTELWIVMKWHPYEKQIITVEEQTPREYDPEKALLARSPGEIIRDDMDRLELSAEHIARHAGITREVLDGVLDGSIGVDGAMAEGLQAALQRPIQFWLSAQARFSKEKAEFAELLSQSRHRQQD